MRGNRLHARQRANALDGAIVELIRFRFVVADQAELGAEDGEAARREAEIHLLRLEDAARQQSRRDQQHQRDRCLRHEERVAQRPAPAATVHRRRSPLSSAVRFGFVAFSAGARPARRPATVAIAMLKASTRESIARVSATGTGTGSGIACMNASSRTARPRPGGRAQHREHQAFGQQLANQSSAARADRQADADLLLPSRGARQEHVRDVDARDEQNEPDTEHQRGGDRPHRRIGLRMHAHVGGNGNRPLLIGLGMRGGELRHDHLQVRFGAAPPSRRPSAVP